jgi:chemotaxis protein MotB
MFLSLSVENIMPSCTSGVHVASTFEKHFKEIISKLITMSKKSIVIPVFLAIVFCITSCVPSRQFDELKAKEQKCQDEIKRLQSENQDLNTKLTELNAAMEKLSRDFNDLVKDSLKRGEDYRRLTSLYKELTNSYDKLLANNEKLLSGSNEETRKLIAQLNDTRTDLQRKEDELKKKQADLADREARLTELKGNLKDREDKVAELQGVLNQKDSAVKALKDAVNKALVGFVNNGLSVEQKNGKVYVSMEEQLLFASGSTIVDKRGEEALKKIAVVLEGQKDINVMVEGHTDNVPIQGTLASGAKDNWDLSVLRATSVVKILTKNSGIDPIRISASGRGPFFPLDPAGNAEARKKNRRTEIILTPKLDELLKVLESN